MSGLINFKIDAQSVCSTGTMPSRNLNGTRWITNYPDGWKLLILRLNTATWDMVASNNTAKVVFNGGQCTASNITTIEDTTYPGNRTLTVEFGLGENSMTFYESNNKTNMVAALLKV